MTKTKVHTTNIASRAPFYTFTRHGGFFSFFSDLDLRQERRRERASKSTENDYIFPPTSSFLIVFFGRCEGREWVFLLLCLRSYKVEESLFKTVFALTRRKFNFHAWYPSSFIHRWVLTLPTCLKGWEGPKWMLNSPWSNDFWWDILIRRRRWGAKLGVGWRT